MRSVCAGPCWHARLQGNRKELALTSYLVVPISDCYLSKEDLLWYLYHTLGAHREKTTCWYASTPNSQKADSISSSHNMARLLTAF